MNVLFVSRLFGQSIGLASQGCFRGAELTCNENKTVSRDRISSVDLDDVTDDQVFGVSVNKLTIAHHHSVLDVILLHQFLELLFFGVVIGDCDPPNDEDGDEDTGSLLESVCPAILNDTKGRRYQTGDDEDPEDEVFEHFLGHHPESANFSSMALVLSEPIHSNILLLTI